MYVPMRHGWLYLTAVIDWFSRKVLSRRLSNTQDVGFCCEAFGEALGERTPEVFSTDQGCQYPARSFTSCLEARGVAISMDGRGRALDNVFIERLWRSVQHEEIHSKGYETVADAEPGMVAYFAFYNGRRRHQSLGRRTPEAVYSEGL